MPTDKKKKATKAKAKPSQIKLGGQAGKAQKALKSRKTTLDEQLKKYGA